MVFIIIAVLAIVLLIIASRIADKWHWHWWEYQGTVFNDTTHRNKFKCRRCPKVKYRK